MIEVSDFRINLDDWKQTLYNLEFSNTESSEYHSTSTGTKNRTELALLDFISGKFLKQ